MSRDSVKMMSHMSKCVSHRNRYDEAIFAIGITKKFTGEKRKGGGGWYPPGRPRINRLRYNVDKIMCVTFAGTKFSPPIRIYSQGSDAYLDSYMILVPLKLFGIYCGESKSELQDGGSHAGSTYTSACPYCHVCAFGLVI